MLPKHGSRGAEQYRYVGICIYTYVNTVVQVAAKLLEQFAAANIANKFGPCRTTRGMYVEHGIVHNFVSVCNSQAIYGDPP